MKIDKKKLLDEFKKKAITEVIITNPEEKDKKILKPKLVKEQQTEKTEYEKFKIKYKKTGAYKDLKSVIELEKGLGNNEIFTLEEFLLNKFKHKESKIIIIDPTLEEMKLGKKQSFKIVKPMYSSEYNEFIKTVGQRDYYPEEFMKYMLKNCILFPKVSLEEIETLSAGVANILYSTCLQISTFNSTYKILEV